MKRDGVYRFQPAVSRRHPGAYPSRGGAGAAGKTEKQPGSGGIGEYLDRHPQWETPEVRIKIEQQSALTREKLEELVRRLVEEKLASLPVSSQEADPAVEEELDSDISQMLENLELFQS